MKTATNNLPATNHSTGTFGDAMSRKLCRLDSSDLCAEARRKTGLEDFGEPPVEPVLSVLVDSLEHEADLHPFGRFLMRIHLLDLLKARLQLVEAWKKHPEILESPIAHPIFITGMPRSGSTFLHELMGTDPDLRVPRVWETMFPLSASRPDSGGLDSRVLTAEMNLWWFRRFVPQADAVYPMRARTPHECVAIQSYTFLSEEFIMSCRLPSYESVLRSSNMIPTYAWEKHFLQYLQQHAPIRRWVLKAPDHDFGLEALFAVFPDAVVIMTHRNPLEVLKSTIHLSRVLQGLYSRPGDLDTLMERESRILVAAINRLTSFRDAHPELAERFIDICYSELVADPLAIVSRIYRQYEITLTEEASGRMRQLATSRTRYPGRNRVPTLQELGIDVPAQERRFEGYCQRFGISSQKTTAKA
jgi:hypothetical protein